MAGAGKASLPGTRPLIHLGTLRGGEMRRARKREKDC